MKNPNITVLTAEVKVVRPNKHGRRVYKIKVSTMDKIKFVRTKSGRVIIVHGRSGVFRTNTAARKALKGKWIARTIKEKELKPEQAPDINAEGVGKRKKVKAH